MEKEEIIEIFSQFVRENYYEKLIKAVSETTGFLLIDFSLLDKYSPELASYLLENPEETIEACEEALKQIDTGLAEAELRVRFVNLPEDRQVRIRNIRSQHLGKMIAVDGFVKRASEIRPEVCETIYECSECGNTISIIQKERILKTPERCDACGSKRGFRLTKQKFYDARWIVVEEPYEITTGERPSELMIYLKEDLTSPKMQNKTEPGNRIKVVGILKELPRKVKGTRSKQMEIYLDANSVESIEVGWEEFEITPEDEKKILELAKDPEIYSKFIASIAPSMYGMEEVKEALLLQLVGGEPHLLEDGTRIRGNIHILLVGDPASGKSQLMQYISKLIPRGRYVSGSGVTGVGLCTVYDTLIQLEDGTLMKIGDLVEKEFKRNKPEKVKKGVYRVKASDEIKILAFNQKNLKIEPKKITYYWKIKAPHRLVEIETRSGRKIIVTPENPIPIVDHGKIVWMKAKDLNSNHYIATPRAIRVSSKLQSILDKIDKSAHVLNSFFTVAYLIEKIKEKCTLREFCRKFGIKEDDLYYNWKKYSPKLAELEKIANYLSINLEEILPNELWLSQYHGHQLKLPLHLNEDIMYLMGLIAGDGSISETSSGGFDIKFFNIHDYLLDAFSSLCEEVIGIKPSYDEDSFGNLLKKFGIPDGDKSHNLTISEELSKLSNALISSYLRGVFDTDGSVIKVKRKGSNFIELSSASEEFIRGVQLILLRFGIISRIRERGPKTSKIRGKLVKSGEKYVLEIRGVNNLKKFEESIGFSLPEKSRKLKEIIEKVAKEHTNVDLVPQIGELLKEARKKLKLSAKDFYGYKNYSYEKNKRYPTCKFLQTILDEFGTKNLEELKKFADSDIFWDKVKKVRIFENKEHEYVYDVSVEDAHSFVGNGIVIHNTAAVTRDEEFLGGWVLEAGAIVMSNKSVCCIDEFSKVSPGDRVALQEAMSLETISIAKASIVATLPAQTAILAGANPKLGRFDPYLPIREQVDIDDVLLSRFDLKFALRDIPNPELDAKMAEHILKVRHLKTEEAKPIIPPEFLRKYIAYARAKVHPVLTKEAGELLMNFYLEMRKKSGEEAPIAITLRQYEALIRLAEASAKIQLRNFVTREDAERAIRLMKISLREFGFEPETGMFDIDRAEGQRITAAQRGKIRVMIDVLEELTAIHGKNIPQEEFLKRAKEEGVEDAEEILRKMISEGIIFQPKPGFIQKV
jgi:DNA replicative helicase MCM subunit Mcm2 (Cdc46/Mcm family)